MNPYEEAELEARDIYCIHCGRLISMYESEDNDGMCRACAILLDMFNALDD